jgi:hypothetical protein
MKIVNIENGKKKVYVQLNDVMMLMQFDSLIPVEVMDKIFSKVFIVTDENRFEFAEFVDDGTVEFFEACEWIPDFRKYKNMTEEEIVADGQIIANEMNEIAQQWNSMNDKQREKNEKILTRYKRLEFKMHSCAEILFTKQGHRVMPFPIVPDYEGFKVAEQKDCPYVAQQGLNPLQVLLFRTDGKKLDEKNESIPQGMIQATDSILINDNLEHNEFFGEFFERNRSISDDGKYLVTTFKIIPRQVVDKKKKIEKENNAPTINSVDKPKSLTKKFKNWIDKTFK